MFCLKIVYATTAKEIIFASVILIISQPKEQFEMPIKCRFYSRKENYEESALFLPGPPVGPVDPTVCHCVPSEPIPAVKS